MKKSELKIKDVINVKTGKNLGYIEDIEIDLNQGTIEALIIPPYQNRLLSFFTNKQNTVIEWSRIEKIGEDVILVKI